MSDSSKEANKREDEEDVEAQNDDAMLVVVARGDNTDDDNSSNKKDDETTTPIHNQDSSSPTTDAASGTCTTTIGRSSTMKRDKNYTGSANDKILSDAKRLIAYPAVTQRRGKTTQQFVPGTTSTTSASASGMDDSETKLGQARYARHRTKGLIGSSDHARVDSSTNYNNTQICDNSDLLKDEKRHIHFLRGSKTGGCPSSSRRAILEDDDAYTSTPLETSPGGYSTLVAEADSAAAVPAPAAAAPALQDDEYSHAVLSASSWTSHLPEPENIVLSEEMLAVARMVDEESTQSLPQALHMDANELANMVEKTAAKRRRWTKCMGCFGAIVIVLIVAVTLSVVYTKDIPVAVFTSQSPTSAPTGAPTSLDSYVISLLPEYTTRELEKDDKDSPQAKALEWLLGDKALMTYSDERVLQRFVLAVLYYATNGERWIRQDKWMSHEHHECEWEFSTFFIPDYDVEEFQTGKIDYYNGTSPCEVDWSPSSDDDKGAAGLYRRLWLINTGLVGTLPEELYSLTSLETIAVTNNKLEGTISTLIGQLTSLQAFNIDNNLISGPIPIELTTLSNLSLLLTINNDLTGSIPSDMFHRMSNLEFWLADANAFTGTVPSLLGLWTSLKAINLSNNLLTSTIPTDVGLMTNLYRLSLWGNQLSGTLPTELGNLQEMITFDFEGTSLTGRVPTEIGNFGKLVEIYLQGSDLTGPIPSEFGLLASLESMVIYASSLSGPIPSEFGLLTSLEWMYLPSNSLSGPIPTEFGLLTSLEEMYLLGNSLSGHVPSELGQLDQIGWMVIEYNELTGALPSELARLTNMTEFLASGNQLTGSIPFELEELVLGYNNVPGMLNVFNVSDNHLSGLIPEAFCELLDGNASALAFDCSGVLCGCDCSCSARPFESPSITSNTTENVTNI